MDAVVVVDDKNETEFTSGQSGIGSQATSSMYNVVEAGNPVFLKAKAVIPDGTPEYRLLLLLQR
jgi:hypothetical protein